MRNILKIFKNDLKSVCSHFFPLVIAIGLCALPALYAWFNIYANWDPYGSTGNIKIAVVSLDQGYDTGDGTLNMGDSICDSLREATSIGWEFVDSEQEAVDGVYSGKYYASIVIAPDFTESMYTALSDNFKNPRITYYENEKKNAVGTKITDTAVDTLRKTINQQFVNVVTSRIFEETNAVSTNLSEDSAFDEFEENLKEINRNLKDYQTMVNAFIAGNNALETSIADATGAMDGTRQQIANENQYIAKANQDMVSTNASLAEFNANITNTMNAIETSINAMSTDITNSGLAKDTKEIDNLMNQLVKDAQETSKHTNTLITTLDTAILDYETAPLSDEEKKRLTEENTKLLARNIEIDARLQVITTRVAAIDEELVPIENQLNAEPALSEEQKAQLEQRKATLTTEKESLTGEAETLTKERASNTATIDKNALRIAGAAAGEADPTEVARVRNAISVANEILTFANGIATSKMTSDFSSAYDTYNDAATTAKTVFANASQSIENIKSLYSNTLVPQMNTLMASMQQVMDNVNQLLSSVESALGDMDTVFAGIVDTVDSTNTSLQQTSSVIAEVSDRLTEITDRLDAVSEDERAAELMKLLGGDPEAYGSFFSEPVVVNTNEIYPVKNYGSAVTPFYTTLAIWVGSIFLTALFKVKADPTGLKDPRSWQLFLGRYQIFFLLSQIQALIIVIGDIAVFKVQCLHPGMFWFASAVTAFVFSILIYSLALSFGDIGKALAVVMVVIQIAGSSGTFPIELLPDFYRRVYIFFPFPYAINAMRECIGGLYENTFGTCLWELLIFAGVFLFIGLVVRIPLVPLNHFIEERMEDTKIL